MIQTLTAHGRNRSGGRDNCWPFSKVVLQRDICLGGREHYLLCNASFQSDCNQFSYTVIPPSFDRVLIKATPTAFNENLSHFSILVQYLNLAAFIASSKFTKSITFEETSSCDLPVLAVFLQDQYP